MYSFRELEIWKNCQDFCTSIYSSTSPLPANQKKIYILELRQLSVMLPTNIALAFNANSKVEFLRFIDFSLGAAYEIQTHLLMTKQLDYLTKEQFSCLQRQINQLIALITKIRKRVKQYKIFNNRVLFSKI